MPLGLYCHVPFCPATCGFCAFYQARPYRKDVVAFLDGVKKERARYPEVRRVDTIYFGGGTPGLLSVNDLGALCTTFSEGLESAPLEWTVELGPSTVNQEKVRCLKEAGVTRLSLGVQSFNEALLKAMGRPHTPLQAQRALDCIRAEAFANVNMDLIFAVPGQTPRMLQNDLEQAMALSPDHISLYCLTYEEDTPLYRALCRGAIERDEDGEADLYLRAWDLLEKGGYAQYEISNFARPGYESLHNLNTWRMHQWIGFGPSAASQYRGARYTNAAGLAQWLRKEPERTPLSARMLVEDALIFGFRMTEGISPGEISQRFTGIDLAFLETLWQDLIKEGLMERKPDHGLALTLKGRLVADRIGLEILMAFDSGDFNA